MPAAGHHQALTGPGDADVHQPPLLLQVPDDAFTTERQQPLLDPHEVDAGKLEALGGVQARQHDAIIARPGLSLGLRPIVEHDAIQESPKVSELPRGPQRVSTVRSDVAGQRVDHLFDAPPADGRLGCGRGVLANSLPQIEIGVQLADRTDRIHLGDRPQRVNERDERGPSGCRAAGQDPTRPQDAPDGALGGRSRLREGIHGGPPDPPGGPVDPPPQPQVVVGIDQQLPVGQHVADLLAVEEAGPAHHAMGDPPATEGLLELLGLAVGPVQDGELRPLAAQRLGSAQVVGHELRLVDLVPAGHQGHRQPLPGVRPEALGSTVAGVCDHRVRSLEDRCAGAVVAFERQDLRPREVLLEFPHIAAVRPAPAVDCLVVVADRRQVSCRPREGHHEAKLDRAGVLELVDQEPGMPGTELRERARVLLEQAHGQADQIVEVDATQRAQGVFVGLEDAGGEIGRGAAGAAELARADARPLRAGDLPRHVPGLHGSPRTFRP